MVISIRSRTILQEVLIYIHTIILPTISHSEAIEMFPKVTFEYLVSAVVLETSTLILLNDPLLTDTCCNFVVIAAETLGGVFR